MNRWMTAVAFAGKWGWRGLRSACGSARGIGGAATRGDAAAAAVEQGSAGTGCRESPRLRSQNAAATLRQRTEAVGRSFRFRRAVTRVPPQSTYRNAAEFRIA